MARGLRNGLSTGTCAAAAAKAACLFMEGAEDIFRVQVTLPDGEKVRLGVHDLSLRAGEYRAYVFKDGGDDPDATHGMRIGAGVRPAQRFMLYGGPGVGTVTRPGLAVSPGNPAINPVPAEMIRKAVAQATKQSVAVRIIVPRGKEVAAKTFNRRLGIVGGISILGSTGRVRPFSLSALRETVRLNLRQALAAGWEEIVLVPGNIGRRFALSRGYNLDQIVQVGNDWGAALESLNRIGGCRTAMFGHPGKLLKLTAGDFDTHSKRSKSAVFVLAGKMVSVLGHGPQKGAGSVQEILDCLASEERKAVCNGLAEDVLEAVSEKAPGYVSLVRLIDLRGGELGYARR
ncbi:MAG: cobalt-precorrin-5B (C(1))-methyltransferase CbiD [Thermodesulfobacteriota bacterium]